MDNICTQFIVKFDYSVFMCRVENNDDIWFIAILYMYKHIMNKYIYTKYSQPCKDYEAVKQKQIKNYEIHYMDEFYF